VLISGFGEGIAEEEARRTGGSVAEWLAACDPSFVVFTIV
jgi:hypothetical protein